MLLVYFALDLCIVTIYLLFVSIFCFCVIDSSKKIFFLHYVPCFVINLFSLFYAQTVFIYKKAMFSAEIAHKNKYCYYFKLIIFYVSLVAICL